MPARLANAVGRHGFGHELGAIVPERDLLCAIDARRTRIIEARIDRTDTSLGTRRGARGAGVREVPGRLVGASTDGRRSLPRHDRSITA